MARYGDQPRDFRAPLSALTPVRIRRRRRWPNIMKYRSILTALTVFEAWTSIVAALSGRRCRGPSRELRPAQMQRRAQRPQRDRQILPRRLDAPYTTRTEL